MKTNVIYNEDFIKGSDKIADGSVDLILTDPPYGTIKGTGIDSRNFKDGGVDWDIAIEPKWIFDIANRILRKNGKLVLFSQEPYTSRLITEAIPNLPFSYRMVWEKNHFAHGLTAKKAPVNYFEDILVFSKKESYVSFHPLRNLFLKYRKYFDKQEMVEIFMNEGRYKNPQSVSTQVDRHLGYGNGIKFEFFNESLYDYLNGFIFFQESYEELKKIHDDYQERNKPTFNLWESQEVIHPLREYFREVKEHIGLSQTDRNKELGHRRTEHSFYVDSSQFSLCTKQAYNELIEIFSINKMDGFKPYDELKQIDNEYKKQVASTFNLWEGKKHKSNILKYSRELPSHHPTMKPTLLLEDLIKTYSNKGDLVVDLTIGSGSTAIACLNTDREYIGYELGEGYYKVAQNRIKNHQEQLTLV